jgi:hypothetical protein
VEYIAFLFLGIGVLLVAAGIMLQANEKQRGQLSPLEAYARPLESAANTSGASVLRTTLTSQNLKATMPVAQVAPATSVAPAQQPVPGPFQFVQDAPAEPAAPPMPAVSVSVGKANPRLFEKFAYLYLDSSARNIYDGTGSVASFDLNEVNGIRRFGRGVFSYDGFGFYFDHTSGQERFPLQNLKTIGFYPNCIALTFRTNQPVALLFMEETESIRKVLETFRTEVG